MSTYQQLIDSIKDLKQCQDARLALIKEVENLTHRPVGKIASKSIQIPHFQSHNFYLSKLIFWLKNFELDAKNCYKIQECYSKELKGRDLVTKGASAVLNRYKSL